MAIQSDNTDVFTLQLPVSKVLDGDYTCELTNQTTREDMCVSGTRLETFIMHLTKAEILEMKVNYIETQVRRYTYPVHFWQQNSLFKESLHNIALKGLGVSRSHSQKLRPLRLCAFQSFCSLGLHAHFLGRFAPSSFALALASCSLYSHVFHALENLKKNSVSQLAQNSLKRKEIKKIPL